MTSTINETTKPASGELNRKLSLRHIRFIAFGSAIGTGLFYGSSETIQAAGPAVLIAYIVAGVAVYAVMRALGEMAVRHPVAGSFAQYSSRYIGPLAGFLTGWTFTFEMIIVAIADMTAAATYMSLWYPDTPGWVWMVAALLLICGLNLMRVKVFGELEFWFTLIKIVTIGAMILGGLALIIGGVSLGGFTPGPHNLFEHSGFAPFGVWGIVMSLGIVVFSFGGVETLGMTAGEADRPERAIPRAVNTVPVRILLFYILTITVMLMLIPWTEVGSGESPFVQVFSVLGLPGAAHVINAVVLSAALSAMNSITYAASRMMYGLAEQGHAPKSFTRVSASGVPIYPIAIVAGSLVVGLFVYLWIPDQLFLLVASIATFATVFTWASILLAHLNMRREMARHGLPSAGFAAPFWPLMNYASLAFMGLIVVLLAFNESGRMALIVGAVWIALLLVGYRLFVGPTGRARPELPVRSATVREATADSPTTR